MDRFIAHHGQLPYSGHSHLKSNMDRFIVNSLIEPLQEQYI